MRVEFSRKDKKTEKPLVSDWFVRMREHTVYTEEKMCFLLVV